VAAGGQRRHGLITGLSGQDGSFLAELLLSKGYRVSGLVRRGGDLGAAAHLRARIDAIEGDLCDAESLAAAVKTAAPDELYHLAAPSFVPESWSQPAATILAIAGATAALLESVRDHSPGSRVFLANTGQMFGEAGVSPQREDTPCRPLNPYASAKLAAHQLVGQLRAHDDLFACSGILYNHESERRPEQFVSRKITRGVAAIKVGLQRELVLGDLNAVRDWSFAGDIMYGAWLMLQQEVPDDYILASGTSHTVGEMAEIAFDHVGLRASDHVCVDPDLVRPPEPTPQIGDPARARERLGWTPTLSFEALVHRMVDHDLAALHRDPSPTSQ